MDALTNKDKELVQKYFEQSLESLDMETFKKVRNQLRLKYHPDKYEKYEDEVVKEMMLEKYQEIETLCQKVKGYLENKIPQNGQNLGDSEVFMQENAQFSFEGMAIEVITSDKDLKYHLFGTQYRWLEKGDKFRIPNNKEAFLTIKVDYKGINIGFTESIKMFLTFGVNDSVADIVEWLYLRIVGRASALIIEQTRIPIDINEMNKYIRKKAFLQLSQPKND
jgi:hypothetical protein